MVVREIQNMRRMQRALLTFVRDEGAHVPKNAGELGVEGPVHSVVSGSHGGAG